MRRLKGFFVSFVLTALLLVVVAFVLYQTKTSMEHIGGAILLVYAVAAFVGGMIFSAQKDSRHYLMGGLFGLAYFGVVYGVSAVWNKSLSTMFPAILQHFWFVFLPVCLVGCLDREKIKKAGVEKLVFNIGREKQCLSREDICQKTPHLYRVEGVHGESFA